MSHGGDEDDLAAQAWPGFVDILSSVLIMFVFFLMLTAVALAFHTALYKSKVKAEFAAETQRQVEEAEKKAEQQTQTSSAETAEQAKEAAELAKENEALKAALAEAKAAQDSNEEAKRELETKLDVLQQSAVLAESKDQTVKTEDANNLIVFYGADAISITADSDEKIKAFLAGFDPASIKVTVTATRDTSNAVESVARRVAVARMLNLRNSVIKANVPVAQISAKVVDGQPVDEKLDWVRMTVEMK